MAAEWCEHSFAELIQTKTLEIGTDIVPKTQSWVEMVRSFSAPVTSGIRTSILRTLKGFKAI